MHRIGSSACIALIGLLLGCSPSEPAGGGGSREQILSILEEPDVWRRTSRLAELLSGLPEAAVDEIGDLLMDPRREVGDVESLLLVRFWARYEPAEAAVWALTEAAPSRRIAAITISVTQWARVAPEEVVSRLGVTGAYLNDAAVMRALVGGWFESGHPGLETYVRDLGRGIDRQRAVAILGRAMIDRGGPEAAMGWAEAALEDADESFALDLTRQVGSELALADPRAGVAWCAAHCEGPHGDALRQLVATRWAAQDFDAAMDWLEGADAADPEQRQRALRAAYRIGLQRNRPRALAWVEGLDANERRDPWRQPAIEMYVSVVADERPEQAIEWASYIQREKQREVALIGIAKRWRERDPEAAETWLAGSPLSEEARERARAPDDLQRARLPRANHGPRARWRERFDPPLPRR